MKLVILRNNLLSGLRAIEKAVSDNINLPILKNFLLEAKEKIILISTNLELAVKSEISGKIIEKGEISVPFGIFSNIVSNLNSERITLEQKDKNLIVSADNYEAVIRCQPAKDFPIIPTHQNKTQALKIKVSFLREALSQVIVATQYSDIRPEISGVFLDFRDRDLYFVATDSFRLAEKKIDSGAVTVNFEKINAIIPYRTAQEIFRLFADHEEEEVGIFIDPNQVVFQTQNHTLVSRLIDGSFPDYLSIVPKKTQTEIVINKKELISAVKLASVFSGRASDVSLRTGEGKKFLELFSADSALGENRYRVSTKTKNGEAAIVFNWRYLLDGLKINKSEEVVLGINASDKPATIRGENDPSLIYVVMPIKS